MATPGVPASTLRARNGPRPKSRARQVLTWVVTLAVVGLVVIWAWGKLHAAPAAKLITAKVSVGDLVETVSASGSVTAQTGAEVHIGSQISGTIKRLATDVGSHVKAGQLIAELDLPDLRDQLRASQAALAQAETKYSQEISGVNQVNTQTSASLNVARQAVLSARQKLRVAQANAKQQNAQTPSDIRKGETALSTARSTLAQTQAGANLQVTTAEEAVTQAQANATNSAANLARYQKLYAEGFVAKADLDSAVAQNGVYQSQVRAAEQNVDLVKQKVAADLQAARDSVGSAEAALAAAKAETQTVLARAADVRDAETAVKQADANLQAAIANGANDVLKQQDVQVAKEAVSQAEATVAYNQAQMNKSFIRSPISGTVLQLAAQQGETVAAGLSTQTLIIVADLNRLEVDAYVDETDIGKVKLGQPAQCSIDAFPDQTFSGKVTKIASGSTIQQGVVTYDVTVAIQDPKHELKPDMTASVSIQTGKITGALLVPAVAVQIGSHGSTVNVVKIVDGKQTIVATPVVTGGTDGVNIEIKSGLNEGDTIVLAGGTSGPARGPVSPFGPAPRGGGGGARGG